MPDSFLGRMYKNKTQIKQKEKKNNRDKKVKGTAEEKL